MGKIVEATSITISPWEWITAGTPLSLFDLDFDSDFVYVVGNGLVETNFLSTLILEEMSTQNRNPFITLLGTITSAVPGLLTTMPTGQAVYLDSNLTTYTYRMAGISMLDLSSVTGTFVSCSSLTSQAASVGTLSTNQLQITGPFTGYGVGNLLLRAFDATAAANSGAWVNNPISGRPYFSQLVNSLNYTNVASGVSIGGDNSNYFVRFSGYIAVNTTDTYTFQVSVDDGARIFINNLKILESWKTQGITTYTSSGMALTAGAWVPFSAEWWQGTGASAFQVQFQNTTNQTTFTPLTHGTAAGQIQMAYDNLEHAPAQLGTTFVNGDLLIGGALNIPSTTTPISPLQNSVTLYNDASDAMTKIVQPGGVLQNLSYGSEFAAYVNTTSQTSGTSGAKMIGQQTNSLLGGTYRVDLSYSVRCISSGYTNISLAVDGVTVHSNVAYSYLSNYVVVSDFSIITLAAGSHSLLLSFKAVASGNTSTMGQATIAICRVA